MPQLLFDVYVAQKLTHLFEAYLRSKRAARGDHALIAEKVNVLSPWLKKIRAHEYAEGRTLSQAKLEWQTLLSELKSQSEQLVVMYNMKKSTHNDGGTLSSYYLKEADSFLEHTFKLYELFGVGGTEVNNINTEMSERHELLQYCMEKLYFPESMKPEDWANITELERIVGEQCQILAEHAKARPESQSKLVATAITIDQAGKRKERPINPSESSPLPKEQRVFEQNACKALVKAVTFYFDEQEKLYVKSIEDRTGILDELESAGARALSMIGTAVTNTISSAATSAVAIFSRSTASGQTVTAEASADVDDDFENPKEGAGKEGDAEASKQSKRLSGSNINA